jgi:predicted membrane channel-forming protein YqfA (hemolysin III family)
MRRWYALSAAKLLAQPKLTLLTPSPATHQNVHTHLWPALAMLFIMATEREWLLNREPTIWGFYLAITCCLFLSAAFHLCAPFSEKGHRMLLLCDQLGILGVVSSSFLAGLHAAFHCSLVTRHCYICFYSVATLGVLVHFSVSPSNAWRKNLLIAFCSSAIVPVLHLVTLEVTSGWVWVQYVGAVVGCGCSSWVWVQ